jgi:hypothetical protein
MAARVGVHLGAVDVKLAEAARRRVPVRKQQPRAHTATHNTNQEATPTAEMKQKDRELSRKKMLTQCSFVRSCALRVEVP